MEDKMEKKVSSQSRSWIFTLKADNNGVMIEQKDIEKAFGKYTYICQLERGEDNGFLHYQGYIDNKTPISFKTLKNKFPTIHLEPRRGKPIEAYNYCTKEETRVEKPFGNMSKPEGNDKKSRKDIIAGLRYKLLVENVKLSDLILEDEEAANHIKYLETLNSYNRARLGSSNVRENLEVTYLFGASGVGKTRSIYEKHGYNDVYFVSDYKNPFDKYDGQRILVLDEFSGQLPFETMLKVLDIHPTQLGARYENKWAEYAQVYLVSNLPLSEMYKNERVVPERWKALTRRIHNYVEMLPSGDVVEREKPKPLV